MSIGGGETARGRSGSADDNKVELKTASASDDFGHSIARIAVAQICESTGFQSFRSSDLDVLTGIAIRYLREIGKSALFYANFAGRTNCNVFDILLGLEDLASSQGFSGASNVNRCLATSGVVCDIVRFVRSAEEIPLACPVPRFPIVQPRNLTSSSPQICEALDRKHIPYWLPAFPDPRTYARAPVWNFRLDKIEQARQWRKGAKSLLSLQQQFACNGEGGSDVIEAADGHTGKVQVMLENNCYLSQPWLNGEEDALTVTFPAKLLNGMTVVGNEDSVSEIVAPATKAEGSGFCNSGSSNRNILPSKRSSVHFRLGTIKKSSKSVAATPLDENS